MSRFDTLYLGSAQEVSDELDSSTETETTVDDLRAALVNATKLIAELQQEVRLLKRNVYA